MATKLFACLLSTVISLASFIFAEEKPVILPPSCGAPGVKFEVKTEKDQHPPQPEAGKALVYFIQDDSDFLSRPRPTTRMGVDGGWGGAIRSNSYFYLYVAPGTHHLCASWQRTEMYQGTAAAHFTAEAGGVYYFGIKDRLTGINFNPLDSDEGQFLVNNFTFSTSHMKK